MARLKLLLPFVFLSLGAFILWGYWSLTRAISHTKANQYINIPKNSSTQELVSRLKAEGVLDQELPLLLYVRLRGLGPTLKAGDYKFPSPISPLGVINKLQEGQQRTLRFTVIEGWTRWDIANAIAKEIKTVNAEQALKLMDNTTRIKNLDPIANNLEGYLYPDTYFLPLESTPQHIIDTLVNKSLAIWSDDAKAKASQLNLSPRQILTIASMIETEAKLAEERPLVASVIYNRLKLDIPLGIDSTIVYASKLAGKWRNDGKVYKSDLERESPYNTRKNRGLPPGPIASSSNSSIQAALNPAQTNYLYYVRNPDRNDGAHNFYSNSADFEKGVQALREWEQKNPR